MKYIRKDYHKHRRYRACVYAIFKYV